MNADVKQWAQVGRNVSHFREERGMTADELAVRLHDFGLPWTQATVANVETGLRRIDLIEASALVSAFNHINANYGGYSFAELTSKVASLLRINPIQSAALRDAEKTVARKLGVEPVVVAEAAFGLWGQSLSERRDNMAWDRIGGGVGTRRTTLQAIRGRVTRELIEDIASVVAS